MLGLKDAVEAGRERRASRVREIEHEQKLIDEALLRAAEAREIAVRGEIYQAPAHVDGVAKPMLEFSTSFQGEAAVRKLVSAIQATQPRPGWTILWKGMGMTNRIRHEFTITTADGRVERWTAHALDLYVVDGLPSPHIS